jgi:release factor glutamine methyltransferase
MDKLELFNRISDEWNTKLHFLDDKPEETIDSTLTALWYKAAGYPISAARAQNMPLPVLTEKQINYLYQLIQLRAENTPLSYITGRQTFMGIEFQSDKRALIPRKETELLGKKALELSKKMSRHNKKIYILDVCCGSGNLGIAVAHYNPNCIVYSSDISPEAVDLTQDNINLLNLSKRVFVKQGDMMSAFEDEKYYEKFDMIICNPPYILSSKVPKMDLEIRNNEPTLAFDGGMLGIKVIQKLVRESPKFLKNGGWLAFEVGLGQGEMLTQLCERTQLFEKIDTILDDSENIRVISAQKRSLRTRIKHEQNGDLKS